MTIQSDDLSANQLFFQNLISVKRPFDKSTKSDDLVRKLVFVLESKRPWSEIWQNTYFWSKVRSSQKLLDDSPIIGHCLNGYQK
jgi:hypothetical protein